MRCFIRSVAIAGVLAAGSGGTRAAAAAPADPKPSPVHVDLSADVQDPKAGDVVTYTVRVRNESSTSYPHMNVFQLLPAGFRVTESTPKATVERTGPEWTVDVPAGATMLFSATATAGTVAEADHIRPAARQRQGRDPVTEPSATPTVATTTVTTTACARDAAVGPALACGSAKQTLSDAPDGADASPKWHPGLLGLGFMAVLFAGFRGMLRRRSARRAGPMPDDMRWSGR